MMLRSATLLLFALTASSTHARINQKPNKNSDATNDALAARRLLHPLQRQNRRAALLDRFANNGANSNGGLRLGGGGNGGGGTLLDSFLGGNNGDSDNSIGDGILGGEGPLRQFLDSLLVETEFPQDLLNGDGDMSEMITELLQTIMTMLQDGGGAGNGGLLNPENNLQTIMSEWLENLQMADIGCGAQDQSVLPECSWNLQGDAGVWVCRSMYNPETGVRESVNTCAHPQLSFATLDQCGACPLETTNAPAIVGCTCSCTTNNGAPGVGMTVVGGAMERCYAAGIVNSAVNIMPQLVQCATC